MSNINIIDIEASGLHFDSYPIEVAVLVNGKYHSWLIKPEPNWTFWCDTAENLHGVSREKLQEEGVRASDVVSDLVKVMSDSSDVLYSDASYWDSDWVSTLFFSVKQEIPFHINSIYDLLGNKSDSFIEMKERLANTGDYRQHRATEDVKMIHQAFIDVMGL